LIVGARVMPRSLAAILWRCKSVAAIRFGSKVQLLYCYPGIQRLTATLPVAHSVDGVHLSMFSAVRGVSDWLVAKRVCLKSERLIVLAVMILTLQTAYGQEKVETPQQTNERIAQLATLARAKPANTPVGAGDLLHIDVFDVPELSRDVRVSDSGDISYPLIPGKIEAAGLSPFQLEDKVEQLLIENGLVSHPQVSVFVKEQTSQPISVVGAVGHTMIYQVMRPTTLLEVLTAAGGISDDAGSVVIVTRPVHTQEAKFQPASDSSTTPAERSDQQSITIKLQDLLESGSEIYNIPVYGGDTVSVPRAGIVYVLGAGIAQPGGYVLQSHGAQVTVLKVVALAHGLTAFAKGDSAVIIRNDPVTGQRHEIPVRIKAIEKRKADDVALNSNDVLYVPDSTGKRVLARGTESAIGIGTSVAVYRAY
jgi:polysaccharide export outer membrane protein